MMENSEFSFREIIEGHKHKRGFEIPKFRELKEEFGQGRSQCTITGTFVPMDSRIVDIATGQVARATLFERLRAHSLAFSLGARSINGLVSDVLLSSETTMANSQWPGETGAVIPQIDPTWNADRIAPMRLYTSIPVASSIMAMHGPAFETYMADLIARSQAEALDNAIINGNGITSPLGILNDPAIQVDNLGANGRAITLDDVLDAEEIACPNHYDSEVLKYAYLMNAETRKALKQTPKIVGGENMIMAGSSLNGHPAAVSAHMPNNLVLGNGVNLSALIFGNFYDIAVLTWGAFDILVDHYSAARNGVIWIHCSSFVNVKILKPENFNVKNGIVA
jgi:HK97 family phage major capsid protein